jgi:hypothetical protein
MNEFNAGLEVNFLGDKEIDRLLGNYGTVYLINKTPWPRSKLYGLLFLKDLGHITFAQLIWPGHEAKQFRGGQLPG